MVRLGTWQDTTTNNITFTRNNKVSYFFKAQISCKNVCILHLLSIADITSTQATIKKQKILRAHTYILVCATLCAIQIVVVEGYGEGSTMFIPQFQFAPIYLKGFVAIGHKHKNKCVRN